MSRHAHAKDYKAAYGKLIVLDIETTPHLAYTFGLRKTTIPMENVLKESSILSFAWKVYGAPEVFYEAVPIDAEDKWDDGDLCQKLHRLLTKVTGVIGHNITAFDIPLISRRFFHHNLGPVPKLHLLDTLTMAKDTGRGLSNKLAYLTRGQEGLEKSSHGKFPGMSLWMQYLAGNPEAYQEMEDYNVMDIRSNEVLFDRLRPYSNVYIPGQREAAERNGAPTCFCGSSDLQSRGFYTSRSGKYRRYRCNQCGKWLSSRLSEKGQGSVSRNVLKGGNQ